jgi:hypothetical protein
MLISLFEGDEASLKKELERLLEDFFLRIIAKFRDRKQFRAVGDALRLRT